MQELVSTQHPSIPPQPIGPPQPSLYPYRGPSLCSRCFSQYNPSFSFGGLCPNCSLLLPTMAMQHMQQPVVLSRPDPQTSVYKMSDVLHVIDDVLKEQEERDGLSSCSVASSPVTSSIGESGCACGVKEPLVFCSMCQCLVCSGCLSDHEKSHHRYPPTPSPANTTRCVIIITILYNLVMIYVL